MATRSRGTSRSFTFWALVTILFVVRLSFYAVSMPIWEGFDEWSHVAYVDHLRLVGGIPDSQQTVSPEIACSLELLPLPAAVQREVPGSITHASYWRLEPESRSARDASLRNICPTAQASADAPRLYEAQQPPLAYALAASLHAEPASGSLLERVFTMRLGNVLIAALVVPLAFLGLRECGARAGPMHHVGIALALSPGLAVFLARVSNDALATVLIAAAMLVYAREQTRGNVILGALLTGLALLTKAYAVLLLPCYVFCWLPARNRDAGVGSAQRPSTQQALLQIALFGGIVLALAGWWYLPIILGTGTLTGEQLDVVAASAPLAERLAALTRISWWKVYLMGTDTHIWIGGWSFLVAKPWMYWLFRSFGVAAILGLALSFWKRRQGRDGMLSSGISHGVSRLHLPLIALFLVATAYHAVQMFLVSDRSSSLGWYVYGAAVSEAIVLFAGLLALGGQRWGRALTTLLCVCLGLFDLYTTCLIRLPFYAGLSPIDADGRMRAFSTEQWPVGGLWEFASRLVVNKPEWLGEGPLLLWWTLYLVATLALMVMAVWSGWSAENSEFPPLQATRVEAPDANEERETYALTFK